MKTFLNCTLIVVLSFSACRSQAHRCVFPADNIVDHDLCGYIEVPENRLDPKSRTIELAYMVIKSTSANPHPDPVVFLQGGPGGSVLPLGQAYRGLSLDKDRDFILFDARGTGFSQPLCVQLSEQLMQVMALDLQPHEEYQAMEPYLRACLNKVEAEGIDLAGYSTQENVWDLEDLREHLGYNQWNIYGGSYGSRLGLIYMDQFPNSIRSATLIGVFPPQVRMYDSLITNFNASLQYVIQECRQDPECARRYPDLEQVFFDTYASLKDKPLKYQWNEEPFTLNSQDMLLLVHQQLYARSTMTAIPALIYAIKDGDEGFLQQVTNLLYQRFLLINLGTFWSVMTCDEGGYDNEAKLQADLTRNMKYQLGIGLFSSDPYIYEIWNVNNACADPWQVVQSDIPTLLVSGEFDPVTPTTNAHLAAKTLSQSTLLDLKQESHAPFNACFFHIAKNFLDKPEGKLKTGCANQIEPWRWD